MQLIDCPAIEGKRWEWHFVLFKDWLRAVEGGLSNRKYVKWLRGRKIFDRGFTRFVELLLGVSAPGKQAPTLNEVGEELVEELGNSERARAEAAQSQGAEPGRDEPAFPPRPGIRRRRGDDELEAANPTGLKPPTADDDPFLRALLERFGELNGYLTMFTLRQLGDDFLGTNELYRRIGSNDFEALRPSMKQFEGWLRWLEWLGGVKKVGFRFKATKAGLELSQFLGEMPLEELLDMGGEEPEEPAAAGEVGEAGAAGAGPAAASAEDEDDDVSEAGDEELGDGFDASFDDDDDDELEGLDLPPEAAVDPEAKPYWQQEESQPAPVPSLADLTADLRRLTEGPTSEAGGPTSESGGPTTESEGPTSESEGRTTESEGPTTESEGPTSESEGPTSESEGPTTKSEGPTTESEGRTSESEGRTSESEGPTSESQRRAPEAAKAAAAKAAAAKAAPARQAALAPLPPLPATHGVAPSAAPSTRALLQSAARWWLQGEAPERATSGISLDEHPSGRPVGLFKLLALATLLEAEGPPAHARALFDALEQRGVLERMLLEGAPLESALEVAWELAVAPRLEERLVHLARYRARLRELPSTTLKVPDVHALARRIRAAISGETLHAGLLLVVRELASAGVGPRAGLEQVEWLPTLLDTAECPA